MNRTTLGAVAILALAGVASAQTAGDILFVSNQSNRTGETQFDTIGFIPGAGGAATTLYTSTTFDSNFRHVNRGPGGGYYFSDATLFPSSASTGAMFTVDGLFSGFQGTRNNIATGGLVNSPFDFSYHAPSNSLITINNPSGTGSSDNPEDGITSVALPGGALTQLFQEPLDSNPNPRYDGGTDIVADPARPGSYYVLTVNDGLDGGFSDDAPSILWRLTVSNDLTSATVSMVQDFSASQTGFANSIDFATSIDVDPATGDVLVTGGQFNDGKIYRVGIDGTGASTGVSVFADIFAEQAAQNLSVGALDEIEWDPFNNRWILAEFLNDGNFSRISAINADGSGYTELATGFAVNDIIVIPTPGAASMLALAGLAATRRRRSA
ncbi:MAG: hypothetical protein Tsb0013_01470 [Phycisphaerales bacterium]